MKLVTVIGARPQFIKAASLSRFLRPSLKEVIVHTGQHYDENMSAVFFRQLQLSQPDYHLGVGSGTHGQQTARMLSGIENVLLIEKPDIVLVYGDTNSTLAGSLAAAKLQIPVAHVEAGLRKFDLNIPEEINRVVTDHLSTLLFCPTQTAVKNLEQEGKLDHVYMVGDIMYDSVIHFKQTAFQQSKILQILDLSPQDYYVATIHRAENTDTPERLKAILLSLLQLDQIVVFPMHPRTKKMIEQYNLGSLLSSAKFRIIEPLDYFDTLYLISQCKVVFTDSGGIQREAYMLRVPCITMLDRTEWVETVQTGWNHLMGSDTSRIADLVSNLKVPSESPPLFGDGHSAEKIYKVLTSFPKK